MKRLLIGSIAGFTATAPMTAAMKLMHENLPPRERYPLPPRQIAMQVARKAGVARRMDEPERWGLTVLSHFAFGTAMGGVFGVLAPRVTAPAPVAGMVFGLAVWAGSYLGWLPALKILRPATEHPPRRTALMIAAHVVWGLAAGLIVERLGSTRGGPDD